MKLTLPAEWWIWPLILVNICAMVACFATVGADAADQEREWRQYALDHQCKAVEKMPGDGLFGAGPRVAWICRDGVKIWRNGS